METVWLVTYVVLWGAVLFGGLLLLGLIRQVGVLRWRLEQMQATAPRRLGREGLPVGATAPDFELEDVGGAEVHLRDYAGSKVLLVFTQPACGPCDHVVPELNALQRKGELKVVAISNGEPETSRAWAEVHEAEFPVLCQEHWKVSRRYEVFATPFAFLIDERGLVGASGIVNEGQHLRFLLSSAREKADALTIVTAGNGGPRG